MFLGFILMAVGIHGLVVLSEPRIELFEWVRWKTFFLFLGLALVLHVFLHIVLPLLITVACNIRYGRRWFDPNPLPAQKE